MGKTKGPYHAEFPEGSTVRIACRNALESFMESWTLHHKLEREQLDYAGKNAVVTWVGFYHGADELYQLDGIPGVWHEQCLAVAN